MRLIQASWNSETVLLLSTVAHNCHHNYKFFTAKPKTFTAKQNSSRQNQKGHGKTKRLTAKSNTWRQNQKARGKTKKLAAKPNSSRQNIKAPGKTKWLTAKPKSSRQNQKAHGKTKKAHGETRKGRSWTLTVLAMVVEKKQDMVALFSRLRCFVLFKLRSGGCVRSEVLRETWSR